MNISDASGATRPLDDDVLASALRDLETGLTPLQVLDRYERQEAELAPLLETAYDLRTTRWPALSMAGRVKGRERMHAALAEQKRRKAGLLPPVWRQVGVSLALMVMAGAAFLASPYSPLDLRKGSVASTATAPAVSPVGALPSSTAIIARPTASRTATRAVTPTNRPTLRPSAIMEPTEELERITLPALTLAATAEPTPSATSTRRATRVPTRAPSQTPNPTATALPASDGASGSATQAPAPTALPPSPTIPPASPTPPVKPSQTPTTMPTALPEATYTSTPKPVTPTRTPRPATVAPSPTVVTTPTEEPEEPTPTAWPPRKPTATPGPSETPEATRTRERDDMPVLGQISRPPHPEWRATLEPLRELIKDLPPVRSGSRRP